METSNHLKEYAVFNIQIITTGANTTAYQIKQTQGAEYGDEAEKVRACFEEALNKAFGKEIEVECNDCDWKGMKSEMETDEDGDDETDICPCCGSDNLYYW